MPELGLTNGCMGSSGCPLSWTPQGILRCIQAWIREGRRNSRTIGTEECGEKIHIQWIDTAIVIYIQGILASRFWIYILNDTIEQ